MMHSRASLHEKPQLINIARILNKEGKYQYLLPLHWSLHLYEYYGQLRVGETPLELHPGSLTLVPPNTPMEFQISTPALHYVAHFALSDSPQHTFTQLPLFYDVRSDLYHFEQSIVTIGRAFIYHNNPLRAEIGLWNLLWELEAHSDKSLKGRRTSLEKVFALIDSRLGEPIAVNLLAREVGLSPNHLTRLFRQEIGLTVVAYVRQQRARRAKHLLENTTLPFIAIASQINVPNLQSFSTLIKKETGHAPGYWRRHKE